MYYTIVYSDPFVYLYLYYTILSSFYFHIIILHRVTPIGYLIEYSIGIYIGTRRNGFGFTLRMYLLIVFNTGNNISYLPILCYMFWILIKYYKYYTIQKVRYVPFYTPLGDHDLPRGNTTCAVHTQRPFKQCAVYNVFCIYLSCLLLFLWGFFLFFFILRKTYIGHEYIQIFKNLRYNIYIFLLILKCVKIVTFRFLMSENCLYNFCWFPIYFCNRGKNDW